jgi:hypothetical protein
MSAEYLFHIVPAFPPSQSARPLNALVAGGRIYRMRLLSWKAFPRRWEKSMARDWKCEKSRRGSAPSAPVLIAIAKALWLLSMLGTIQPAEAAPARSDSLSGGGNRWTKVCKADIHRFCDEANLKQECLVAHWSKISSECQGVLGSSAGNRAGDGS